MMAAQVEVDAAPLSSVADRLAVGMVVYDVSGKLTGRYYRVRHHPRSAGGGAGHLEANYLAHSIQRHSEHLSRQPLGIPVDAQRCRRQGAQKASPRELR